MCDKSRALPSWMSKKEKEEVKGPLKSKRKPKVARCVFYCMNEKELVEAAVSALSRRGAEVPQREHQAEAKGTARPDRGRGGPGPPHDVEPPVSPEAQDRTCVSESDTDTTELETLPYPLCTDGSEEKEVHIKEGEQNVHHGGVSQAAAHDDEREDDAFQLVREIFFT